MYVFTDEEIKKLRSMISDLLFLKSQYIIEGCLQGTYCSAYRDMQEDYYYQEDKFYKFLFEHYTKQICCAECPKNDLPFPSCDGGCDFIKKLK